MRKLLPAIAFFSIILILSATPIYSQQWFDATALLDEQVRQLAETYERESIHEFQLRTRGIVQHADSIPPRVGDEVEFNTFNFATMGVEVVTGVLTMIGESCYLFVEKGNTLTPDRAQKIVSAFDNEIYPNSRAIFGSEWVPGVDSDPRVTIFLLNIRDGNAGLFTGGYFFAGDCYPIAKNALSNQREMLYMNLEPVKPGTREFLGTVAHEFQHMIHWYHDPLEYTWLDEALSQLSVFVNGFDHPPQIFSYIKNSDNNLIGWSRQDMIANYGQAYLFARYLMGNVVSDPVEQKRFIRNIVSSERRGISGINDAIKKSKLKNTSFASIFRNFNVANFINDRRPYGGRFGYDKSLGRLKIEPMRHHNSLPASGQGTVKLWSSRGVRFDGLPQNAVIRVDFDGQKQFTGRHSNTFDVAAVLLDSRGNNLPKIEWLRLRNGRAVRNLSSTTAGFDSLVLVVVNRGPEEPAVEQPFAKGAVPSKFEYSVTAISPTRSVGSQEVAMAPERIHYADSGPPSRRASRRSFTGILEQIVAMPQFEDNLASILDEEIDVSASMSEIRSYSDWKKYNDWEDLILETVQGSIDANQMEYVEEFYQFFNELSEFDKQNLHGLKLKVDDILVHEVYQNGRSEFAELIRPLFN